MNPIEIPGYKIITEIAAGGMGKVYMATQTLVGRRVVIKVIAPQLAMDESFRERFLQEATCGVLDHPNIVKIFDAGMTNDLVYIVMEFLPGGDLSRRIKEGMSTEEIVKVTKEVAAALGHSHKNGIVHRDVKPGNILFREDGSAVLMDFGIAKVRSTNKSVTQVGMVVGSSHYMSPEQAQGDEVDGRTDLYSLGIVLYEMLTGQKPYDGVDTYVVGLKHIKDPIPRLPEQVAPFQPVIDKLMAKAPGDRYQNGDELISDLGRVNTLSGGETRAQQRMVEMNATPKKRAAENPKHKIPIVAAASIALGIVGGIGVWLAIQNSADMKTTSPTSTAAASAPMATAAMMSASINDAPPVVEPRINRKPVVAQSLDDAAQSIVDHLGRAGANVYPPHPDGAVEITPFGRAVLTKIEERINKLGESPTQKSYVLNGSYSVSGQDDVTLEYSLFDHANNKIDQISVVVPKTAYAGIRVKPRAPEVAQMFIQSPTSNGDFTSTLTTNRGTRDLLFNEGETVKLFVKLTKPGYFYIVGHVVRENGEYSYLVELNNKNGPDRFIRNIPADKAGKDVAIGEFIVKPPFGMEYLQLVASTENLADELPKANFDLTSGYYIIDKSKGDVKTAMATVRGLKLKLDEATTHESQLAITTMAGR